MIVALSSAVESAWWVSLAVGLVVALVVWFLLEWLRRTVKEVDRAVDDPETVQREIALTLSDVYADNDPTVFAMRAWFALALVGLGA